MNSNYGLECSLVSIRNTFARRNEHVQSIRCEHRLVGSPDSTYESQVCVFVGFEAAEQLKNIGRLFVHIVVLDEPLDEFLDLVSSRNHIIRVDVSSERSLLNRRPDFLDLILDERHSSVLVGDLDEGFDA